MKVHVLSITGKKMLKLLWFYYAHYHSYWYHYSFNFLYNHLVSSNYIVLSFSLIRAFYIFFSNKITEFTLFILKQKNGHCLTIHASKSHNQHLIYLCNFVVMSFSNHFMYTLIFSQIFSFLLTTDNDNHLLSFLREVEGKKYDDSLRTKMDSFYEFF